MRGSKSRLGSAFRTRPTDWVDTLAADGVPATLAYVTRRPRSTICAERDRHVVHLARRDAMSTTAMRIIASITRILTDWRSVPKIIGMGPMSRIPAPRVSVLAFADLVATKITATNARTNPMITRANPTVAMETSLKVSQA